MKCKYCKTEMIDFSESFIVCPNKDCPHRDLEASQRSGAGTRGYCIRK